MTAPTSLNSGHTATLCSAQIRQSQTSHVPRTLSEIAGDDIGNNLWITMVFIE